MHADQPARRDAAAVRAALDREFAALVIGWGAADVGEHENELCALRRRVLALCAAGVHVALIGDDDPADVDARLRARPTGPGRLLLAHDRVAGLFEVDVRGPRGLTGRTGSWADGWGALGGVLTLLARVGIGAGLTLVVGNEFAEGVPGAGAASRLPDHARCTVVSVGPEPAAEAHAVLYMPGGEAARDRLVDQVLRRRWQGRVPSLDEDPAWLLCEPGEDTRRQRVSETLLTLAGGGLGTRGAVEEEPPGSVPLVVAAGVYTGHGPDQHLLAAPDWIRVDVDPPTARNRRVLDLRTGVLLREEAGTTPVPLRSARFASVTLPGVMLLRAEAGPDRLAPGPPLRGTARSPGNTGRRASASGVNNAVVATAAVQRVRCGPDRQSVERTAAFAVGSRGDAVRGEADRLLDSAERLGFDRALAEHRRAWARRWEDVDVRIPADPQAQLAARFALFQLWSHTSRREEVAIGARGLTGNGYCGHVFWDSDVFVLPAMATVDPPTAHAMVTYRIRRLPQARARARAHGLRGARFPWESAATGEDVTPVTGLLGGRPVPILTGTLEEHITADVAWGAAFRANWAGLQLTAAERTLLADTARYWASRCRRDGNGRVHIDSVIGPDEYHEDVTDNAYTNVMARWNLRQGAAALGPARAHAGEAAAWRVLAGALVDGYNPRTGRHEQFAGYDRLEPLTMADVAPPPVAADVLLGSEQAAASQIIKQPDVLMLHHLVPDETPSGSLRADLDYYLPRTAHGSSLSPAISASLLARSGRPDEALELLRLALSLDLEDLTATTAAGLHMATLGGVWQCLLFGFAGLWVRGGCVDVDPCLPTAWPSLELRFHALGQRVRLRIDERDVRVQADGPLRVRIGGRAYHLTPRSGQLCVRRKES